MTVELLGASDAGQLVSHPVTMHGLNSLYLAGSDIIASFPHCSQVLSIDRPSGAVVWENSGSTPLRNPDDPTACELVNDDEGEFCGQRPGVR